MTPQPEGLKRYWQERHKRERKASCLDRLSYMEKCLSLFDQVTEMGGEERVREKLSSLQPMIEEIDGLREMLRFCQNWQGVTRQTFLEEIERQTQELQ